MTPDDVLDVILWGALLAWVVYGGVWAFGRWSNRW